MVSRQNSTADDLQKRVNYKRNLITQIARAHHRRYQMTFTSVPFR